MYLFTSHAGQYVACKRRNKNKMSLSPGKFDFSKNVTILCVFLRIKMSELYCFGRAAI